MIENDTLRLLRECDAGIKMGVSAINDVVDSVTDSALKDMLVSGRRRHKQLEEDIDKLLKKYDSTGKAPNPIAQSFSRMKTNLKMSLTPSDEAIADIMTDGCNMGIKSLSRYLNKYTAADERSKSITKQLISLEENILEDMRSFL